MTIQLTTDSGADVPKHLQAEWNIKVVPLFVRFGEEQYKSEDLTTKDFLERVSTGKVFPQSAAPSPQDYYDTFKAIDPSHPIIHISVSSGVSASYNHAVMAKTQLLEEEPDRDIYLIDTKSASSGMILMLDDAVQMIEQNASAEDIAHHLERRVPYLRTVFLLETIDNLIRGGRLSRAKGAIAKTLNVKLILHASEEGKIDVLEKVRGAKKAHRRFHELIGEYIKDPAEKVFVMTHGYAKEKCDDVLDKIRERYPFKHVYQAETGPVIAAHAGKGALVMSFFSDLTHQEKK